MYSVDITSHLLPNVLLVPNLFKIFIILHYLADPEWGDRLDPSPDKSKSCRVLSNTGPDHLKNHKTSKPACKVLPSLANHRNAIYMAFRWWANDGLLILVFGFFTPHPQPKKKTKALSEWTPLMLNMGQHTRVWFLSHMHKYSKICLKWPLKRKKKGFSRPIIAKCWSKVLQNAPVELSAVF